MARILFASALLAAVGWFSGAASAHAAESRAAVKTGDALYRINCGATEAYTDKAGHVWEPDTPYRDQVGWTTTSKAKVPIKNTDNPTLYETESFGDLFYEFKVPNGSYRVMLHFADAIPKWWLKVPREFDVTLQNKRVLTGFKPLAEAGGLGIPVVKAFKGVVVTNGVLKLSLTPFVDYPGIRGIEIYPE
jgi:hypothetical protein